MVGFLPQAINYSRVIAPEEEEEEEEGGCMGLGLRMVI
jgi:hypothetical protein